MCEGIQNMLIDWDRLKGAVRPKKLSPTQESLEQQKMSAIPKRKGRKVNKFFFLNYTCTYMYTPCTCIIHVFI